MTRARHRPPPLLTPRRVIAGLAAAIATAALIAAAVAAAPHAQPSTPVAAPTAVDLHEPTGHGGPLGPVTGPSFAPDVPVWTEDKGPVISDGQALPQPVVTAAPVEVAPESTPEPEPAIVAEASPAPEPEPAPQQQGELVDLVNADRAANGCGPVTIADNLMTQAQTHSNGQAAADSMFHSTGVSGHDSWGENVAVGYDTAAEVHGAWLESTGHRANIMNCRFVLIGYAYADGASGRYWTEMFAQ